MPEWGSNAYVETYSCSSPWPYSVPSGLRRLRRRADDNTDSAGDAGFCGHSGCGSYSRTDARTNPSVYHRAYARTTDTNTDPCAYTDGYAETHSNGDSCANANGDAGTYAGTYGGEQRS